MLHPSTKRLIDKLSDMTHRQRVAWTEGENATVVHDTEGYRVVLTPEPHAVLLTDGMGREIESCLPEEFADELDAQGRPYARFIAELYRDAHRHARGTEKAISTLLAGLEAVEETQPVWPVPDLGGASPDAATDETALIESETAITAAVATLADQINGGATPVAAAPEPEAVPGPVEAVAPVEDVVAEPIPAAPEPEPEPEVALADHSVPVVPVSEPVPEFVPSTAFSDEAPAASVEVEPLAEEPGSFGTFGVFGVQEVVADKDTLTDTPDAATEEETPDSTLEEAPEVAAEAEELPVAEAAPEPETAEPPTPPQAPEPVQAMATPTLAQPISLSSIPFGFGLGAAQRPGAPSHPGTTPVSPAPPAATEPARPLVIDGTLDLPEPELTAMDEAPTAEPFETQRPGIEFDDLPSEPPPNMLDPGKPRRFNPWN